MNQKGLYLDISGQEEAIPQVERKIRTIKERARGIINTLPYNSQLNLIPHFIYFCVSRLNMTPNKDNTCSAWELLYGRKVNYNNLRASFGDYCQAHRNKINNSMNTRTDGCITLYDTGNIEGTWYLYNISTGKLIRRNKFDLLPMPDIIIQHVNQLCIHEKRRISKEPLFEIGTDRRILEESNHEFEDNEEVLLRKQVKNIRDNYFKNKNRKNVSIDNNNNVFDPLDDEENNDIYIENDININDNNNDYNINFDTHDDIIRDLNIDIDIIKERHVDAIVKQISHDTEGDINIFEDVMKNNEESINQGEDQLENDKSIINESVNNVEEIKDNENQNEENTIENREDEQLL